MEGRVINLGQIRRFSKSRVDLSLINNFNALYLDNNDFNHCCCNVHCDVKRHRFLQDWNICLKKENKL